MFGDRFGGVVIRGDRVEHKGKSLPLAGAHATVDSAGEIDKRITATRLVLTGPFALAFRKKKDKRELYLMIEGDGDAFVVEVDPKKGAEARKFAAKLNTAASRATASAPTPAPPSESSPSTSVADELKKLAELRDAGVLSPDEFEAQKARLLSS